MHVSEKDYNVTTNEDTSLYVISVNTDSRVYRADQYIYKFQQSTIGPPSLGEHQLVRPFLFAEQVRTR
jgi:hypothetical protein